MWPRLLMLTGIGLLAVVVAVAAALDDNLILFAVALVVALATQLVLMSPLWMRRRR